MIKKTRILAYLFGAIASCWFAVACERSLTALSNPPRATVPTIQLTVSAAASLKDLLEAIQPVYLQQHPDTAIAYNFGSSGSLQQQIEQGAPVDILISAAAQQMDNLQKKGLLLAETRQDWLTNRLVLIVPKENTEIKSFQDLSREETQTIAIGEPESVPVGKYAKETLAFFQLFNAVKAKAIYGKDARQVLNYVAMGNTDAGIVYETDALTSDRVKIVEIAPENSHSPIRYPIAVIKTSQHPEAAQQFVQFLFSPTAKALATNYGFKPS